MVIMRCGAAQNNSPVSLEKEAMALFLFSGDYKNCSKTHHIFCVTSVLTKPIARNFDMVVYKFLRDEY
jgi:hypothetical protein